MPFGQKGNFSPVCVQNSWRLVILTQVEFAKLLFFRFLPLVPIGLILPIFFLVGLFCRLLFRRFLRFSENGPFNLFILENQTSDEDLITCQYSMEKNILNRRGNLQATKRLFSVPKFIFICRRRESRRRSPRKRTLRRAESGELE